MVRVRMWKEEKKRTHAVLFDKAWHFGLHLSAKAADEVNKILSNQAEAKVASRKRYCVYLQQAAFCWGKSRQSCKKVTG